ncbi:MAG TPA: ABC transporter ATP-binding protein [Cyclobacteriaceae bacterium]
MIEVRDIHKRFGRLLVLEGVSFSINNGGVFAILGPNGSGKTTLLKIILGMVVPDQGDVLMKSKSVINHHAYRKQIAYLPQIARFPDNLTVNELIRMIGDIRNDSGREKELIARFGLDSFLNKKLGELSGGTRQKVNIVLAFMFDAEICILDEPTAGLDPLSLIKLKQLIEEEKRKGKIIIITTHIMPLVQELAQEIIFLLEGKVRFHGSIATLQKQQNEKDLEHAIASILAP